MTTSLSVTVAYDDVGPGTYVVRSQLLDEAGAILASSSSDPVTTEVADIKPTPKAHKPVVVVVVAPPPQPGGLAPPLDVLVGPLTSIGTSAYDTLYLTQAAIWETDPLSDSNVEFYDGALAYYFLYYRTGDTRWLTRADFLAKDGVDYQMGLAPYVGSGVLDGAGRSTLSGRDFTTLSMAIYYLRTGYSPALAAVRAQAAGGSVYRSPFDGSASAGARESAYAVMAMLCSTMLPGGPDYSAALLANVDGYASLQGVDHTADASQPHGGWQDRDLVSLPQVPAFYFVNAWMSGLVMEALIMYDRVIGDARIVPMLKTCVDWIWSTQWVPLGGGPQATSGSSTSSVTIGTGTKVFTTQAGLVYPNGQLVHVKNMTDQGDGSDPSSYGMIGTVVSYSGTTLRLNITRAEKSGTLNNWDLNLTGYPGDQTAPGIGTCQYANITSGTESISSNSNYANLMGLMLPAFGYLYLKGQGTVYKTRGDAVLAALQQAIFFGTPKGFNQVFRSSPRYLGFTV